MRRRDFIALAGATAALPHAAVAQQAAKVPRIVVLSSVLPDSNRLSIFQGLADFGYIDGKNITVDFVTAPTIADVPAYAAQAMALKPDLIVTLQSPAPLALKQLGNAIPVVMVGISDPIAVGAVPSYARQGGNMTGAMNDGPDSIAKTLEVFREIMPTLSRLGLMGLPEDPAYKPLLDQVVVAMAAFNIAGVPMGTKEGDDFDRLFERGKGGGAQAIFVFHASYLKNLPVSAVLTDLAIRHRLPIFSNAAAAARTGGMIVGYQGDGYAMRADINSYRRAGYYVDLIVKGARPGDLPIEAPTNFSLVINLKTAKAIGLSIPQSVLFQATEVVS